MDSQRCHHCGSIGHKKFDCTERCRVGCKWCESPPTRRPPAVSKINLDSLQRQNGLNSQRSLGALSGGSGGQANNVQIGQSVPQIGPAGIPLGPANVQLGNSGLSHGQSALQINGTNVPLGKPQNVGPLLPSILNPLRPLAPQPLGPGWPLIQQQVQQPSLFGPHQVSPQQPFFLQQPTTNMNFVQNTQSVSQFPQSQVQLLNSDNSSIQSMPTVSISQPFSQQFVSNWNNLNNLNNLSIQQSRLVPFNGMQIDQQITRLSGQQASDLNKLLIPKFNQLQFPTLTPDNTSQSSSSSTLPTNQLQTSIAQPSSSDVKFFRDTLRPEKQSNKGSTERDLGDTSTEINSKLQRLKHQIELGIHSKVRPPKWVSSSIDQLPFNNLVQNNKQSSNLNDGKDFTKNLNGDRSIVINKENGQLDHLVEVKIEDTGIMQNLTSPMLNDTSMPLNVMSAATSPDHLFRARIDRSPNIPLRDKSMHERANSHPLISSIGNESQRFERDRTIATFQRNKSRSLSPIRDVHRDYRRSTSPGKYCVRSVTSYDDRYHSKHPGHEYRDKYYVRPSGTEYSEKYYPRSMSLAPYDEYYSRYSSDKHEDRGHSYRDYDREQILVRPRSRSPSVYHQRAPYEDYSRRINSTNGWYGDDPYNRDYQVRSGAYYDLVRDERYENRDRAYTARHEGERGYGDREYTRPMDYEYPSRRRPVDRW